MVKVRRRPSPSRRNPRRVRGGSQPMVVVGAIASLCQLIIRVLELLIRLR